MARLETAPIEESILIVRGQRVILAADLAKIYGVQTRALNQAVKRNRARFPEDFTFQLTRDEAGRIAVSRSQSVILIETGQEHQILVLRFYGARSSHGGQCP
jgi:hypothetical protein